MSAFDGNGDFQQAVDDGARVLGKIQKAIRARQEALPVFRSVWGDITPEYARLSRAAYDFQQKYGAPLKALKNGQGIGSTMHKASYDVIACLRKHNFDINEMPEKLTDGMKEVLIAEGYDINNLPDITSEEVKRTYYRAKATDSAEYEAAYMGINEFIKICYGEADVSEDDIEEALLAMDDIADAIVDKFSYIRDTGTVLLLNPTIENFLKIPNDGIMDHERFNFSSIHDDAAEMIRIARRILEKEAYQYGERPRLSQPSIQPEPSL